VTDELGDGLPRPSRLQAEHAENSVDGEIGRRWDVCHEIAEASPDPVRRIHAESGTNRIEGHVPDEVQEVPMAFD
jgi:hypothetical protein